MRMLLTLSLVCGLAAAAYAGPELSFYSDGSGSGPDVQSGDVIYDNIDQNGGLGGTSPASQLDTTYAGAGFDAGAADDFVLPDSPEGKWLLTELHWSGVYFGGGVGGNVNGFNIIIWPDAGGMPAGGGPGDTPDYGQALYIQKVDGLANEVRNNLPDERYDYHTEIDPKHLVAGVTYWLEIQAQLNFDQGGQWGWQATNGSTGSTYRAGFPLLEVPFWDGIGASDVGFILVGKAVPEPAGLLLLGCGALALLRRRR